jgi:hypothetical protein
MNGMWTMWKRIREELGHHAPFTLFGAITGIIIMIPFRNLPHDVSLNIFYVLHPLHVVLSALVTSSMYEIHKCGRMKGQCNLWALLAIGYAASIGVATLSDSIIPYIGEVLLDMPHRHAHIGFLEKWYIVNPLAFLGIAIAYFRPSTKFPHAMHILVSTWASLFHVLMAVGQTVSLFTYLGIFVFLFLAVWVPCCFSDIVFPLLFIKEKK